MWHGYRPDQGAPRTFALHGFHWTPCHHVSPLCRLVLIGFLRFASGVKVRNPHGKKEIENGTWADDGPGWERYPQIKAALNPIVADNGIFWVSHKEFYRYFHTIYLCAKDMSDFIKE